MLQVRNGASDLVQWLEYHQHLGVDKFFIADDCSADNGSTAMVLEAYNRTGLVDAYFVSEPSLTPDETRNP